MNTDILKREKLIAARRSLKMNQREFADAVGVSRAYLSNIEGGKYFPSLHVARRISEVLNTNIEELFFSLDVRKTHNVS
ncbi:XRE family transcriptional regulator [Alicyclobacillaceae bacterium I2511]|nr:XRE family transcriptional regulator [Alicyclobacillaceae bacterium I2511]